MNDSITLRIILHAPPAGVGYGLQSGHARKAEVVQSQRGTGGDLMFELNVGIKLRNDAEVDFTGPFVQGPAGARFVYINSGSYAGLHHPFWNRRLKVPLTGIRPTDAEEAVRTSGRFETTVPGTARDGGPNCATVKPFPGWTLIKV